MNISRTLTVYSFSFCFVVCSQLTFSSGLVNADPKPKAKPNQTRLMMIDADGKNLKEIYRSDQFTFMGSPAYSPDGKKIALDGWQRHLKESFSQSHIFTINADGLEMKDLGSGSMPSWSADGKRIVFSKPGDGIYLMDADGANRELLDKRGWGAQWSPDGTKIIYPDHTGGPNLKIYNPQQDTFRYVFPFGKCPYSQFYWNCCWSSDSKSICIKARSKAIELITIDIEKGLKGITVLHSDKKNIISEDSAWQPMGDQIIFSLKNKEDNYRMLYTLNPTEKESIKPFSADNKKIRADNMTWHPNGKQLIFTAEDN